MTLNPFEPLFEEARDEAYDYFDRHIRRLPRNSNGSIDLGSSKRNDNDVDAFRHAYLSGVFTQVHGETTANILGLMNEYDPFGARSNSASPRSRNMDLWNNRVGRRYGKKTCGRKTLLNEIYEALRRGELIIDLKDPRARNSRIQAGWEANQQHWIEFSYPHLVSGLKHRELKGSIDQIPVGGFGTCGGSGLFKRMASPWGAKKQVFQRFSKFSKYQ